MKRIAALIIGSMGLAAFAGPAMARARTPQPVETAEQYSLSKAQAIPIPAKQVIIPYYVYGDGPDQPVRYVPSGYMGDAASLKMVSSPDSAPVASGKPGTG